MKDRRGRVGLPIGDALFGTCQRAALRRRSPERVRGEVAEIASGPMGVLQTALSVGFGCDAEILFHFLVPHFGKVFNFQRTFNQRLFDFKADDDVERVGHFIGVDADEAPFYSIDGPVKVFEGKCGERFRVGLLQDGIEMFPEGQSVADEGFPKAGLAFVDGDRGGFAKRRSELFFREPLIVESMPALVQNGKDAGKWGVGMEMGRHADIFRMEKDAKGVHR